ncbi:MAG: histone deacetylase [Anaerolineae bacterium]|nr:histone deacetylase [Anaerolineae bacterium]MDW8070311.1 histone deacetylase [Anaerolineae bacterium]
MKIFYSDPFTFPLPPEHKFPLSKYALLRQRVMESGLAARHSLYLSRAVTDAEVCTAHAAAYWHDFCLGRLSETLLRRIGLPWSPQLVQRTRHSVGGTVEACRAALRDGCAVNLAGGTHHAFRDYGAGYCVLNDSAVALGVLRAEGLCRRVLIIDCDVHQGDGTAAIFADDPDVFTFSIHAANNFPFRKQLSRLDIDLPDGVGDAVYLRALESGLRSALALARAELAIYLAGADPYQDDRLGRLMLSKEGLRERDRLVLSALRQAGIPVAITMAGGYARHIEDTVAIHLQTIMLAETIYRA